MMWIKHKLKEPFTIYMLLILFFIVQSFSLIHFFKEEDALLNYRINSKYMIQYAKAMRGTYAYFLQQGSNDPVQQKMKVWAENGEDVVLFARNIFVARYAQSSSKTETNLPINEDLHILIDLANLYGFDYHAHHLPRPEVLLGAAKWQQLRQYYLQLGTPAAIMERLLYPFDRYQGEREADAPILLNHDPGYHFYIQKILHYVNVVLSDYATLPFHPASPPVLLNSLLSNRIILLFVMTLCLTLSISQVCEDQKLGTLKLFATMPHGRRRYTLRAYSGGLLLGVGGLLTALLPGTLLAICNFGFKGFHYPIPYWPDTYRHLHRFSFERGELISNNIGLYTRGRALSIQPHNFATMMGSLPVWKAVLLGFLCLLLCMSLMLSIGLTLSALSRNKRIAAALAIVPQGLVALSLYHAPFANSTFPYQPFAAVDVMTTVTGMQDFTALSAFVSLALWNIFSFTLAWIVIKHRNLG